jgi:hypothetical protein
MALSILFQEKYFRIVPEEPSRSLVHVVPVATRDSRSTRSTCQRRNQIIFQLIRQSNQMRPDSTNAISSDFFVALLASRRREIIEILPNNIRQFASFMQKQLAFVIKLGTNLDFARN